jgi:hypothetical protein
LSSTSRKARVFSGNGGRSCASLLAEDSRLTAKRARPLLILAASEGNAMQGRADLAAAISWLPHKPRDPYRTAACRERPSKRSARFWRDDAKDRVLGRCTPGAAGMEAEGLALEGTPSGGHALWQGLPAAVAMRKAGRCLLRLIPLVNVGAICPNAALPLDVSLSLAVAA